MWAVKEFAQARNSSKWVGRPPLDAMAGVVMPGGPRWRRLGRFGCGWMSGSHIEKTGLHLTDSASKDTVSHWDWDRMLLTWRRKSSQGCQLPVVLVPYTKKTTLKQKGPDDYRVDCEFFIHHWGINSRLQQVLLYSVALIWTGGVGGTESPLPHQNLGDGEKLSWQSPRREGGG